MTEYNGGRARVLVLVLSGVGEGPDGEAPGRLCRTAEAAEKHNDYINMRDIGRRRRDTVNSGKFGEILRRQEMETMNERREIERKGMRTDTI